MYLELPFSWRKFHGKNIILDLEKLFSMWKQHHCSYLVEWACTISFYAWWKGGASIFCWTVLIQKSSHGQSTKVAFFSGQYVLPFLVHGKTRTSVLTIWAIIATMLFPYAFAIWLNNDLEINRSVCYERSNVEPSLDLVGQPFACGKDAGLWGIQNLATEPCVDELNIIILINNDPDVFGRGVSPVQVKH